MDAPNDFALFAVKHVNDRMVGFRKDIRICLTPTTHPVTKQPTLAFSPALGTCCATLEYLSSLFLGKNDPSRPGIAEYAKNFLPDLYNRPTIEMLYRAFRHAVAHRGIVSGVWIDESTGNRIAWKLSDGASHPAIAVSHRS